MNNLAERDEVLVGDKWIVHCDSLEGVDRVYYGDGSGFSTECQHPRGPEPAGLLNTPPEEIRERLRKTVGWDLGRE